VTGENLDEGGGNGAGKSSFASKGIIWTLYGQTPGGLKADAVINRHSKKKSGWGQVTYRSNGEDYTVKRYRPSKLRLWKGSEEITAKKISATQEMIDQTLGRDFRTFLQTEMFGQGRTLSYPALQPAEQKKVLEQILPIETLDEWAEEAKKNAATVKEQLQQANTAVEVEMGKLNTMQRGYENMKLKRDEWTQDHDNAIINAQKELDKYSGSIRKAKDRIKQIDIALKQISRPTPQELTVMRDEVALSHDRSKEAGNQWVEAQAVFEKWKNLYSRLHGSLPVKLVDLNCPTCSRPWDEEFVEDHNHKYEQHFMRMKEAEVTTAHCEEVRDKYKAWARAVENKEIELLSKLKEMEDEDRKFTNFMMERHKQESFLTGKPTQLKSKLDGLMIETNPYRDTVDEISKDLKVQRTEVAKVRNRAEILNQEHNDLLYWHRAYSKDIKLKLFESACPFLDHAATEHLKALENSQLHVQFSTVKVMSTGEGKEDFNVRCWDDTGGEGFDTLSGGEQQMVSFAIGRALADLARTQVAGESMFQILDEPFSMLDERNSEAIVNYLKKDMKDGTILLISNEDHLKGLISSRINVVKQGGISEVVV
jgi:DNA repair exonuclease SbcCD ATPase subunit